MIGTREQVVNTTLAASIWNPDGSLPPPFRPEGMPRECHPLSYLFIGAINFGAGVHPDFTPHWYSDVGAQLQLTLLIMIVSPYGAMIVRFIKWRCCRRRKFLTQAELNHARLGPEFHLSVRYAQLLVGVFVNLTYSAGMPLLYLTAALAFTFSYWMDKYLFLRFYRMPPLYDGKLGLKYSKALPWAALMHLLVGVWMYARPTVFGGR